MSPEHDGQLRGEPLRSLAIRCSAWAGLYVFGRGLRMSPPRGVPFTELDCSVARYADRYLSNINVCLPQMQHPPGIRQLRGCRIVVSGLFLLLSACGPRVRLPPVPTRLPEIGRA